jgi:O-antigen/teichoic acid export membrane protein
LGKQGRDPLKQIRNLWQALRTDVLLRRVLRNSSYLFSSNSLTIGLAFVQSILSARLLGVNELGMLGVITGFSSTINRLFSFRMGDLVVRYLGDYLPTEDNQRAAALVKVAGLTEAATSILAFLVMMLLAPLGARFLAKDLSYIPLFRLYGLSILGGLMMETANGVLQSTNRFSQQALINMGQSFLTAALILAAFLLHGNLLMIVNAYLLGKLILGIAPVILAWRSLNNSLGAGWWRTPLVGLPQWKVLGKFALNTNLSATVNTLMRDSEVLWVALFLDPVAAGYYKIALAISSFIPIPVTPFISTTFPEISRSAAARAWGQLRSLLKRVTLLTTVLTAGIAFVLVFFGRFVILIYSEEYLPAYPALMVLLIGYGFSNLVFWNRPLLLALDLPAYPFQITLVSGLLKTLLAFLVIPAFGTVGAASLLAGYFLLSGGLMALRGVRQLQQRQALEVNPA